MGQVVRKDKGRTVGRIARRRRIVSLDTCVATDTCQQTTEVNILARERVCSLLSFVGKCRFQRMCPNLRFAGVERSSLPSALYPSVPPAPSVSTKLIPCCATFRD